jgi:hypothetical protein
MSKKSFWKNTLQGFPGVREMGDTRESLFPVTNYNTPVRDLTCKDLLMITFTRSGQSRGTLFHHPSPLPMKREM